MKPLTKKIILASKSPRRSQLLRQAGFNFEVRTVDVKEDYPEDLPVREVAPYLALKKARGSKGLLKSGEEILLTADSVVILDEKIFGKPRDEADAVEMLTQLSGRTHLVVTGVCLSSIDKETVFSGSSKVFFEPLTLAEIEYYVRNFQPFDKAGSYAIQEWIGLCKIAKIEGSYTNIMGLPVQLVYEALLSF